MQNLQKLEANGIQNGEGMFVAVKGKNLSDKHVKRAVDLSSEKYCSASMMLKQSVELNYDYEISES